MNWTCMIEQSGLLQMILATAREIKYIAEFPQFLRKVLGGKYYILVRFLSRLCK